MKTQKAICPKCKNIFEGKPRLTLLGFPRFSCPSCNNKFIYPLGGFYKSLYRIFFGIFVFISIAGLIYRRVIIIPGIITVVAIIALVKDYSLKKKLENNSKE